MNPDKTIEYNSLSWVKAQLDDVLSDAQSNLNDYIESNNNEDLENCIEHLQLIYGTLQMVEVYGASMLAEEMQSTSMALLEGKVESTYDAYDVLMRAMLQLPDYLEGIQAGKADAPISLMPLINDLRAARNEGLLTEGALFSPDLENTQLGSSEIDAESIESGKLQDEVKRLRTHYQLGLLDFIRNNKEKAGLQRIKAVLNSLERVSSNTEVRQMWMIASALVEGLMNEGIDNNLSIKKLLGSIDRQLKLALDNDEEEFANQYSKELVTNILYYVGLCTVESDAINSVKEAYNLQELLPQESEETSEAVGGLNADLFDTVSKGITEDLGQVKDVLELFMHSNEQNTEQLEPISEQLGKIADTYGMLGMGATRQSIMDQRNVIDSIIRGDVEVEEQVILGVASGLLGAESELKDYIAERSGFIDMNRSSEDQAVPAAEYRQVVFAVVSEALKNFGEAKEAVLSYVTGIGDNEKLDLILNKLEEVRGVAMMLPLGRVEAQIEKLQNFIRIALLNNDHKTTAEEQDTVADVVTSIEYFLEALSEGRPGVEQGLNAGDASAEKLVQITRSYVDDDSSSAGVEHEAVDEVSVEVDIDAEENTKDNVVIELDAHLDSGAGRSSVEQDNTEQEVSEVGIDDPDTVDLKTAEAPADIINVDDINSEVIDEFIELDTDLADRSAQEESIIVEAADDAPAVEAAGDSDIEAVDIDQYTILADDADEEIVEIFIEEAVEVLGELHEYLPQWQNNVGDADALAVVRRSFHTLKGSSRLLGAEMIGEFSWKFENLLNCVIENKINTSEALFNSLDEAVAVLPQLVEQLKGNKEPIENIGQLMAVADALAEGRDISLQSLKSADLETADTEQSESAESTEIQIDEAADITGPGVIEPEAEVDADEVIDVNAGVFDKAAAEIDVDIDDDQDFNQLQAAFNAGVSDEDEAVSTDAFDSTGDNEESSLEVSEVDVSDVELDVTDGSEDSIEISMEAGQAEDSSDDTQEDIEVVGFDNISDDLSIGDSSDLDITELDPDNNISTEVVEHFADTSGEDVQHRTGAEISVAESESVEADQITMDQADPDKVDEIISDDLVNDEFEIDENDEVVSISSEELDLDPMLLKIYHDESIAHIENIRQQFADSEQTGLPLKADKELIRAFHTLYGSARTADIDAIAELTGSAEKYIKARQDSENQEIPEDVIDVLRQIEQSVSDMLSMVSRGEIPQSAKPLHDKINKIFQLEIQAQLQKNWQDNSTGSGDASVSDAPASIDESSAVADEQVEDVDEIDVIKIDESVVQADQDEDDSDHRATDDLAGEPESIELDYGDIDDELIDIFLEEADELLESCENVLINIKDEPNSTEHVQKLQRNMHTLKGGARMADLTPVGDLTHNLESLVVMVSDNKVYVDKDWFDLLQESLDALTMMLAAVKKREPLISAAELNKRIEMMMRGEVKDKRSQERFDIELSELESMEADEIEEIDFDAAIQVRSTKEPEEQEEKRVLKQRRADDKQEDRPHWGERASDVNFKDSQEQVRVRSDLLNNLVNYAGEVNIYHARMGKQISDFSFNLSELTQTVIRLKEQLRNLEIETEIQIRSGYEKEADNLDDNFDPLEMDQYSTLQQLTRSLSETAGDVDSLNDILTEITRDSETLLLQESRISTDLQEGLMRTRMVRFGGLSSRLRRITRQVARELGKEVELKIQGETSEVDRTVLDRIIAPLEHMLRNAIAHGIEKPEDRREIGKDETGHILIDVDRQGADVVIKVTDDGAGIDAHKIKQKAIKQGMLPAGSEISEYDALQLILHSGFSTADEVTQVSGRGVGMDVVDSEIKQLGGVLDINTERGKSTEFKIRLPLTLAINQALLVSASDDVFAVPLASIEGVIRVTGLELQRFYDSENSYYEFNGIEYELKHLGGLLTGNQANYSNQLQLFPVLLVHVGDQHFALHVEDLIGRREIVVKPVGLQIGSVHGIAGATILADGRVVLILEMSALVVADSLFKSHTPLVEEVAAEDTGEVKTIMVVDDSITIRKITERMLKRYGVNVILAKDGVDATNKLQEQVPDLMLLDIEMPRMDGFEVASFVKNEESLKDIPIIMITSRTGIKHKEKAQEIGVDRYLGKPFQEEDLMKNINEILQTSL
jgi:chemosensory pili system protein ChpA (sensor histidine kinase/response regulator)